MPSNDQSSPVPRDTPRRSINTWLALVLPRFHAYQWQTAVKPPGWSSESDWEGGGRRRVSRFHVPRAG